MALEASGSALVGGLGIPMISTNVKPPTKRVLALRSFFHRGEVIKQGSVVELPTSIAIEMIAYHRCSEAPAEVEAVAQKRKAKTEEKPDAE